MELEIANDLAKQEEIRLEEDILSQAKEYLKAEHFEAVFEELDKITKHKAGEA